MIDIKLIREEPECVKENCKRRGCEVDIDALYEMDQQVLALTREVEQMRADRNQWSKECKDNPDARVKVKELKEALKEKETKLKELKDQVQSKMDWLPNMLAEDVPDGEGDHDNEPMRIMGEKPTFDFKPLAHDELGEKLGIIDTERGAKVAQSGFYFWVDKGAQLVSSLFFWTQRELVNRGFRLFVSPCVAKESTLYGSGYLPFFADQTYNLEGEDLGLIGTSEQTLVAYHRDEILDEEELPSYHAAFTPCFRTEAGSYGKESKGIFRVHQFHKVEQIVFCKPEDSVDCHLKCLEIEEALLQALGLPYQVVNICVGDLGAPGYKKYDTEAWFPGYGGYREVTSNTNLTDFQSRRLGIRCRDADNRKRYLHTISATAVTDRVACAILENYQQEDGSVIIPEVLRPFTGFDTITPK
jgi:seryl-tRNA synthetase